MPRLLYESVHDGMRSVEVEPFSTIGRGPDCTIRISRDHCSRLHCTILRVNDTWTLEDNGSSNGTWLNARRIEGATTLKHGDLIKVGDTLLQFCHQPVAEPGYHARAGAAPMAAAAHVNPADCVQRELLLKAPLARVWRAVSDSRELGRWFEIVLDGPFEPGRTVHATVTQLTDDEFESLQRRYAEILTLERDFSLQIDAVESERHLSFRWHRPGSSREPRTLVSFRLEEAPGGTLLTVTESGFDQIPLESRAEACAASGMMWTDRCERLRQHLTG